MPETPPPQILVRTGGDLDGPVRLAGMLVLVGIVLVAASWRFGSGGSGLRVLHGGPSGGPGPGGGNWFGRPPEPETQERAWDEWVAGDRRVIPADSVEVPPAGPAPVDDGEVVVPLLLPYRPTGGLDAALDAANAEAARATRPVPPPGRRSGRRSGGR